MFPESSYQHYTDSLKKFGYDFHIIGRDLGWNSWITRGSAMRSAILSLKQNFSKEDLKKIVVVTSDTGDVLVQNGPKTLLEKFNKKKAELKNQYRKQLDVDNMVMVGGEWFCGGTCEPRSSFWFDRLKIDVKERLFPYPQGGFLIGTADSLFGYFNYTVQFMRDVENDDQIAMGNFAIDHPAHIYIDYKQELAATILEKFPGEQTPDTGLDYDRDKLYDFSKEGYALSQTLQNRIGSSATIYPSFLHVPNNVRRESVMKFWEKLVDHLKSTAWQ
jgi:hypothetical protein